MAAKKKAAAATTVSILDVMDDPALFGPRFAGPSWWPWRVALKAIFGLPLDAIEIALFQLISGRATADVATAIRIVWLLCGRRAGKTVIAALCAVYLSCFRRYPALVPGEIGVGMLIAADRSQARVLYRYILALLEVPLLQQMIVGKPTMRGITLRNLAGNLVQLEVHTCSWRSTRGYTSIFAICDEVAAWRSEDSSNADHEVLNAILPTLLTTKGPLICLTSPFAKRGAPWDAFRQHFGRAHDPVLVLKAATGTMNPALAGDPVIAEAYRDDPVAAAAEFGAEFRSDIQSYVDPAVIQALVVRDRASVPWSLHVRAYHAFADMAGGSGQDSATLAIAHLDSRSNKVILDVLLERRPLFSPESVVAEFATTLKAYGIRKVIADRFAGDWPRERFRVHGIAYESTALPSSQIYAEVLPLFNAGDVQLLDHARLVRQLCDLDRRPGVAARDLIAHPKGGHDDLAVAASGAFLLVAARRRGGHPLCVASTERPIVYDTPKAPLAGDRASRDRVTGIPSRRF